MRPHLQTSGDHRVVDQTRPYRRKLIEIDLPLTAINRESVRDMTGRLPRGHPATLHPWWARRPLPACRAIIFASLVDDPVDCPQEFPSESAQRIERERLHRLLERLIVWENIDDQSLIAEARWEIVRSIARSRQENGPDQGDPQAVLQYLEERAQPLYDPFCGRGSIPVEAQRLGLRSTGADLNPVAVLITKALIEYPRRFKNRPPTNPDRHNIDICAEPSTETTPATVVRELRHG